MSLTKGLEGKELSGITALEPFPSKGPLMLSEDGKDLADTELFFAAMNEAKRIGLPVSCHCDFGGEENSAVRRAVELGKKAGCRIHIAHVSTKEALETTGQAKAAASAENSGFSLGCEAMPHNLCLTVEDAVKLGEKTWGRVNPPLRSEEDRKALIHALADGTVDAIATDHAPHSRSDKEAGAPGFSGFETAFAAVFTELVRSPEFNKKIDLKRLSSLMSARPAKLLGLERGRVLPGYTADLVIADTEASWIVQPGELKTRGKNSPFAGRRLYGKVLMTIHSGRVVYMAPLQ
jgi:dihydroorotase